MSRVMPYSPMVAPKKRVTVDAMASILAKHTGAKVEIKPMAPKVTPPRAAAEFTWKRLSDCSIQSSRGQVILKTKDSSSPPNDIYIVFSGSSSGGQTAHVLARFRSAQDAKDYCRLLPKAAT